MSTKYDEDPGISSAGFCGSIELLRLARQALEDGVYGRALSRLDLDALPKSLRQAGACFVTLYCGDQLRGCVGTLEVRQPLAEEVRIQAVAAALQDYRFPRVQIEDLPGIRISISLITGPSKLTYACPEELISRLRPGIDGLVIKDGPQRATFLPHVWDKIPDKALFLSALCQKLGAPADLWRLKILDVQTYQAEVIHE